MRSELTQLQAAITAEHAVQEKLLALLTEERAAVTQLETERIQELAAQKEELLREAHACEIERTRCAALCFDNSDGKRLSQLLEELPQGPVKQDLVAAAKRLKAVVHLVKELHQHNSQLIRHAMGVVAGTMSVMYEAATSGPQTYGQTGALQNQNQPRVTAVTREA